MGDRLGEGDEANSSVPKGSYRLKPDSQKDSPEFSSAKRVLDRLLHPTFFVAFIMLSVF